MTFEQQLKESLATLIEVNLQEFSVSTNFSDLGLDSLIGLRFIRRIEEITGLEIELEWLFDYPSIEQLVRFLETMGSLKAKSET